MNSQPWQFSLKLVLVLQALFATICFIVWKLHPGYLCGIAFVGLPLLAIIWATVRIATRNGREQLIFHGSRPNPPKQSRRPANSAQFLELVGLSGLLTADQLKEFTSRYPIDEWEELCSFHEDLADELVKHNLLTSWQAGLLLAGKYKGFLLGKYKLLKLLGSGGMSSVYLAEHTIMHRQVAEKVFSKSKALDPTWQKRFVESAKGSFDFSNEHFFRVLDLDTAGNTWFQVMEYEPGETLANIVRREGTLRFRTAVEYMAQAALGLEALHDAGKIHCEVNPLHLFLTEKGTIKLLHYGSVTDEINFSADFLLADEVPVEKVDYRAPEFELSISQVGPQADIYSLGCTLFFLLTGHAPYPEVTAAQRINQRMWHAIPDLRTDRPDAPPRLIEILEQMLAKNPGDRYPSAGVLYRDLDAFLRDEGGDSGLAYVS